MLRSDFEIMAPVGSRESLYAAFQAGADAVYFGVGKLNMRAHSANAFTIEDLREIAELCREKGVKSYLTVNTIVYDEELDEMRRIVDAAKAAGISAIIASDSAVLGYAKKAGVEVHLSTQMNISIRIGCPEGPRIGSETIASWIRFTCLRFSSRASTATSAYVE